MHSDSTSVVNQDTDYCLAIERDGSTLECSIYSDAGRSGTAIDTLAITLDGAPDYDAIVLAFASGSTMKST